MSSDTQRRGAFVKAKILTILLLCGATAGAVTNPVADRSWNFDVYVDDKRIGNHVFELIDRNLRAPML